MPYNCLWRVDYDTYGQRLSEPETIDDVTFYISKEYWKKGQMYAVYTVSHLHILTFTGYRDFSQKIASNGLFWAEVFPKDLVEKE